MGLEHNITYKISSVFDGCVLDVSGAKAKKGAKVISWDWSGGPNQMWRASKEGNHGFRLDTTVAVKDNEYVAVLDEPKDSQVFISPFNAQPNQSWVATEVPDGSGAVFIENIHSGNCLRNMGHGNQVKCVAKSEEDRSSWWMLTQV